MCKGQPDFNSILGFSQSFQIYHVCSNGSSSIKIHGHLERLKLGEGSVSVTGKLVKWFPQTPIPERATYHSDRQNGRPSFYSPEAWFLTKYFLSRQHFGSEAML